MTKFDKPKEIYGREAMFSKKRSPMSDLKGSKLLTSKSLQPKKKGGRNG